MLGRTEVLVPHLQRAVNIGRLFNQSKDVELVLTKTLNHVESAVFLVANTGAISFANEPAKRMLNEATLVRQINNALHAVAPTANELLHEIFIASKTGDKSIGVRGVAIELTDMSHDGWFAHVLPLTSGRRQRTGVHFAAVAAVFIRKAPPNAPPPLEAIARQFGLLPGETRVLSALVQVQGVKPLANLLGISQATVKTHLQHLFRKTNTNRQSELIKLVAGV